MKILNVLILSILFGGFASVARLIDTAFTPSRYSQKITFSKTNKEEKVKLMSTSYAKIKLLNEVILEIEEKITQSMKVESRQEVKVTKVIANRRIISKKEKINKDIIELSITSPIVKKALKVKRALKLTSFSSIKFSLPEILPSIESETIIAKNKINNTYDKSATDRISTAQAATEKSRPAMNIKSNYLADAQKQKSAQKDDGLVFFSYDDKEANTTKKVSSIQSSKKIKAFESIAQKMAESKKKISKKKDTKNDYSQYLALLDKKNKKVADTFKSNGLVSSKSQIMLSAFGVNFKGKQQVVYDYRVEFHDDIYEKRNSDSDGYVSLEENINGDYSTRRVSVVSSDYLTMTTELIYENDSVPFQLPLINRQDYFGLMSDRNINDIGSSLLIELDESTDQVDIDSNYTAKLFLDKNYKVVAAEQSDYFYVFYVGLEPGNRIISYKTKNERVIDRIVHLKDSEVFFDKNYFAEEEEGSIAFFEENLMGTQKTPLSISEGEYSKMIGDVKVRQTSLNGFKLLNSMTALGSRKYYVLSHLNEKVYVGNWHQKSISIPSESYMRYVISGFDNYSDRNCMVQVNLEKKAKGFMYNGDTGTKHLGISARILDSDGILYKDLSDQSRRIFLKGDTQGVINLKIDYVDGTVDYLETYCSQSSYLIEQL